MIRVIALVAAGTGSAGGTPVSAMVFTYVTSCSGIFSTGRT